MEEDQDIPIILEWPFLATGNAVINVPIGELSLEVENEKVTFNIFRALDEPSKFESCCEIVTVDTSVVEKNPLKVIEHPKELDKSWMVYPEPIIVEGEEFQESKHYERAALYNCKGRMPKFKNLRNESSEPWPFPLHCVDMSRVLEEKCYAIHQEWNEYEVALGWSINDIKRQTR